MELDLLTLEIVLAMAAVLSFMLLLLLWCIRPQEKGPCFWALSAGVGAAGLLLGNTERLLGSYAIFFNNAGILTALLLLLEGLLRFRDFGRFESRRVYMLSLLAVIVAVSFLNRDYPTSRYLIHDFLAAGLLLSSAFVILYRTKGREMLIHGFSAFTSVLLAPVFAFRWFLAFSGQIEEVLLGASGHPIVGVLYLAAIPWMVACTFGLGLMLVFRMHRQLVFQAVKDNLTGLDNRRGFEELLQNLEKEHQRTGEQFLLFMIDINGFKEINDRYGHGVGDNVLIAAAEAIKKPIRQGDFAVRLGGDEFVVIMKGVEGVSQKALRERLRQSLEKPRIVKDLEIRLRVSIGEVFFPDGGTPFEKLLSAADRSMYREKESRRDLSQVRTTRNA